MRKLVGVPLPTDRHVRVWFGSHVIAAFVGPPAEAARYAAGMRRRFAGLRVTNKPATVAADSNAADS